MISGTTKRTQRAHGLTLIELLAVLVILGLTVSVAAVGLSSRTNEAKLADATSTLASLDASARVLARKGHLVELRFDPSGLSVELVDLCCEESFAFERQLPSGLTLEIWQTPQGVPAERIRIDSRGQSDDYRVRISVDDQSASVMFAGLTGWHEITRSDP